MTPPVTPDLENDSQPLATGTVVARVLRSFGFQAIALLLGIALAFM